MNEPRWIVPTDLFYKIPRPIMEYCQNEASLLMGQFLLNNCTRKEFIKEFLEVAKILAKLKEPK